MWYVYNAQTPAASSATKSSQSEGFYPGWGFGTRFEGGTSGDGSACDIATGVSNNFTAHFGVGLGVPYNFVGTPSSIKTKNPTVVSGYGVGNIGMDLKWLYPEKTLDYASTIHLSASTGDMKKGFQPFGTFACFQLERLLVGILRAERGAVHMARQSEEFHPQAARRMFLAVVNQAISDVLDNNKEAKAAEQWLFSEEFDNFAELLSWDAEGFDQQQAVA